MASPLLDRSSRSQQHVVLSPSQRQSLQVNSLSPRAKLRPRPQHPAGTASRNYTFALVAMTATFAFMQHALFASNHQHDSQAAFSLLQSFQQQPQPRRNTNYYSRNQPPDDIFGPSPPALSAREDHSMDALRSTKFRFGGGQGDLKHLGGFGSLDKASMSPSVWKYMLETVGVKSVLDVGCGRGWSTSWFLYHGVDALCVEGSHDAISQNAVNTSPDRLVEHDFTLGPWWPAKTYDTAWATEFVQQVSLHHSPNYIAALRKTAMLFVTAPLDAGWHHVEVHSTEWWIRRFEMFGWKFDPITTTRVRQIAAEEAASRHPSPDGSSFYAMLIMETMMVFVNPEIARLPQHAHLFPEPGCFKSRIGKDYDAPLVQRECATGAGVKLETKLDKAFQPLPIKSNSEKRWKKRVLKLLNVRRPPLPREARGQTYSLDDDYAILPQEAEIELPPIDVGLNMSSHAVGRISMEWNTANASSLPKIPVVLWPFLEFGAGNAESKQVELDGVQESAVLTMSNDMFDFSPNIVWVGDTGAAYGWNFWCGKLNELVVEAKQKRAKLKLPLQWPIFIVNFSDGPTFQRCLDVEDSVGSEMVKYTMRSIVDERNWKEKRQWVDLGHVIDLNYEGKMYQHTSLIVRTDTVEALDKVLQERGLKLSSKIEQLDRDYDITHFWPAVVAGDGNDGVGDVESMLRTRVSQIIANMAANHSYTVHGETLSVYVGLAGEASSAGRQGVAKEYIESLLNTKIIVITQRDAWEDHYRLFEGLISGAMVMCDRMLSLPDGLRNGTHLIEFTSETDFMQKAIYYLEQDKERQRIAHRGRKLSMTRHRSWHRMEEIIFGRPLTVCSETDAGDCPYTVHANRTRSMPDKYIKKLGMQER